MYKDKQKGPFIIAGLAFSIGIILWVTVFSRVGSSVRKIYPPLWSLQAILEGDRDAFFETVLNTLLFIPFGFFLAVSGFVDKKRLMLTAVIVPVCIEALQWLFRLGATEFDDILTNVIGMYLGAALFFLFSRGLSRGDRLKQGFPVACILISFCLLFSVCQSKMIRFARLNDREDGNRNLLVLNGQSGYASGTDVYVGYQDNGRISISGSSENRSWKLIGEFRLDPGTYTFSGLSGVSENTFAIELEYYNRENDKFERLTPDLGPIKEAVFELQEKTLIRAYVGVYPGAEGGCFARPAIYREQ